jgi:hypothetical protein
MSPRIDTIQEITLQGYELGLYHKLEDLDKSRTEIFSIFRDWAYEFDKEHKDFDWSESPYYDEIDLFLEKKSKLFI